MATPDEQPTPLTEEQLAFFTEQTERAADKASKHTLKQATIGYLILFMGILMMYLNGQSTSQREREAIVESGRVVSVDGCNRDYETIATLRDEIEASKDRTLKLVKEGTLTEAQAMRSINETDDFLERYVLPDCRKAEEVLTSDPDQVNRVPKPKYPGG